ncbi:MAG: RNA methyltransferase [Duncaniella sp.]|nr:RNA methyltransferase [Duncaniella sp.]
MNEFVTKKQIKAVKSLDTLKGRKAENAFKAEGTKCVIDTMDHFRLKGLYATADWITSHPLKGIVPTEVGRGVLGEMSSLTRAADVIAVYELPVYNLPSDSARENLVLALDTIQDPGNLGTIMRVADWFGIHRIIASRETADCYSPKVVQATMGAISRVKVTYGDLPELIDYLDSPHVFGTFLDGSPIGETKLSSNGIIVIGNEGNGISAEVERKVTSRLFIPPFPPGAETAESLNAAVATAITIAKFRGL